MNICKWVKTPKHFFILGKEIRPKGKWLTNEHGVKVRCSNCGATPITEIRENKFNASVGINWCLNKKVDEVFKFCPICGADMRGKEC